MGWDSCMPGSQEPKRLSGCSRACVAPSTSKPSMTSRSTSCFGCLDRANGEQLSALACVARALRDPKALQQVRRVPYEALFGAITDPSCGLADVCPWHLAGVRFDRPDVRC